MIYVYCVLDFRVVVFWWRAQGPPENAKIQKDALPLDAPENAKIRKSEKYQK